MRDDDEDRGESWAATIVLALMWSGFMLWMIIEHAAR